MISTSRPSARFSSYSFWMSGSSFLHGTHHVAQKFSHTTFPFIPESVVTNAPSASHSAKSGGAWPITGGPPPPPPPPPRTLFPPPGRPPPRHRRLRHVVAAQRVHRRPVLRGPGRRLRTRTLVRARSPSRPH